MRSTLRSCGVAAAQQWLQRWGCAWQFGEGWEAECALTCSKPGSRLVDNTPETAIQAQAVVTLQGGSVASEDGTRAALASGCMNRTLGVV